MRDDKINILLVDDQPAKLLTYEAILGELGENLIKASSGEEALEHLLKTEIAVVLLDVYMPNIDGFELAALIRQHPRHRATAIIFISAIATTDLDRVRGFEYGAVDYVSVPIEPELLRARITVFADLHRKTMALESLNRELEQRVADRTAELEADLSERKRLEKALRESAKRLEIIQDRAPIGICETALDGCLLRVNDEFCRITGYTREELLARRSQDIAHPDDIDTCVEQYRRAQAGEIFHYSMETRYLHKDNSIIWIELRGSVIRDAEGKPSFGIGVIQDITERKQNEKDLVYLANYDALTGLPNRALLMDRLSQALARALRYKQQVALLFLDLDGFKHVNDTLGHDVGDLLLKTVGERLTGCIRASDTVARLGGDEFVLMLTDVTRGADVNRVAQLIVKALSKPLELAGNDLFITTSIGISLYPRDGGDVQALLKSADAAMYLAKKGGNCYQHYSPALGTKAAKRLAVEQELRRALTRDEFVLHYQPQVDLATGEIDTVEALIRWRRPGSDQLVPPLKFIPLAEESDLIVAISEWVLRAACTQIQAWRTQGGVPVRLALNISARQFQQKNMKRTLDHVLKETGLDPSCLEFELTESMLQTKKAERMLPTIRKTGIKIAIDDFGTGFSSLSYLKRFSVDKLKIDRSFTRDIPVHANNAAITTAVIALAHSLNLEVTAEGIETDQQLAFLRTLDCDAVQGYLLSKPLPAEDLAKLLIRRDQNACRIGMA